MGQRLLLLCGFLLITAGASAKAEHPTTHALLALGAPYRYGGSSPETGFDCSGLVAHAFERAWGLRLPRSAREQSAAGIAVSLRDIAPGDLLFYNTRRRPFSHVAIYLGDGRFIHAPRRGQRVRIERIQSPYWAARFNGARRIEKDSH
jgi:cell wall-associated NlpC family hydrolase